MSDTEMQVLVDSVECFGVDSSCEIGVLLGPVFEY